MFINCVRDHPSIGLNKNLEESKVDFSKTYGWNLLKDNGFKCVTQATKWSLDSYHRKARLKWAKEYIKKPDEFWFRVIFTDETIAKHKTSRERYWVEGEFKPEPAEQDRWGESRLVWGTISYEGKCIIEIINGTMKSSIYLDILRRRLLKNYRKLSLKSGEVDESNCLIFQQDGSSSHTEKNVNNYFLRKGIQVLPWPAKSPDLNPIEEVWAWLKNNMKFSYQNGQELEEDIKKIWNSLQISFIKNLYHSMRDRIQAVIKAEGGPTDY